MTTSHLKWAAALKVIDKYDISLRRACRLVSVDPKTVGESPSQTTLSSANACERSQRHVAGSAIAGSK